MKTSQQYLIEMLRVKREYYKILYFVHLYIYRVQFSALNAKCWTPSDLMF